MDVEQLVSAQLGLNAPAMITTLLEEFSAVTDYRTLRDSLPQRLAHVLKCRCVLLYQRVGETLQFAAGTFDDIQGWSASLLSVAHINPIDLTSDLPEATAWRMRHAVTNSAESAAPKLVAVPLIYRQRAIGVLVAYRNNVASCASSWSNDDLPMLEAVAGVVALLLENTRLLERDRQRIHELSLLNSIASQLNCSMYEPERIQSIIIQRTREITAADLCELIRPASLPSLNLATSPTNASSWLTPTLRELLLSRFSKLREPHFTPLLIERPGDAHTADLLQQLPSNIKTFFAVPLLVGESILYRYDRALGRASWRGYPQELPLQRPMETGERPADCPPYEAMNLYNPKMLGVIVGAYHQAWKLRREELVLLQVLANQASAVLENMHLMTEVVEARNEARKLLRQVLDDQRLKELILESVPSGLITIDLAGQITTFNRSAQAILGYHPCEVLGQPLQKILNLREPESLPEQRTGPMTDTPVLSETLVTLDQSGQEVALDVQLVPLHNDQREQIGNLATFTDVTSIYRLEEEKRRLDRLASLGGMAASVAHEVRNPLASIKTSMLMLKDDLPGDEQDSGETQEAVSVVLKEVERLDAIVHDLLLFAKPRQLHCVACDLVKLSDHVLQVMQAMCTEMGVEIHRVYRDVPFVYADAAQMEQVLVNLYMNAVQAMSDGGVLSISFQVVPASAATYAHTRHENGASFEFGEPIGVYSDQQNWLELSVSDTGVGIAPDQLGCIFQPFYTTKAHGIGLGLPITRRLVEDHRGHMLVESQPGYGATISVRLPI
jgi:PAS domain S-box-containing protein